MDEAVFTLFAHEQFSQRGLNHGFAAGSALYGAFSPALSPSRTVRTRGGVGGRRRATDDGRGPRGAEEGRSLSTRHDCPPPRRPSSRSPRLSLHCSTFALSVSAPKTRRFEAKTPTIHAKPNCSSIPSPSPLPGPFCLQRTPRVRQDVGIADRYEFESQPRYILPSPRRSSPLSSSSPFDQAFRSSYCAVFILRGRQDEERH